MKLKRALRVAALAVLLVVAGGHSSRADVFDFGSTVSCYDYDPYDRYHLYGKYYPYSRSHCRHRSSDRHYISCRHGARIVDRRDYSRVQPIDCNRPFYRYRARRDGDWWIVRLNARNGNIVSRRPL
jgi:hypothetical protein